MSEQTEAPVCYECKQGEPEQELRPYGPGGQWVCHPCATATPEKEDQAKQSFHTLLDAAAAVGGPIILGTPAGPLGTGSNDIIDVLNEVLDQDLKRAHEGEREQ